ncbi:uncharacterized protein LOC124683119 [Lolium rigidum]|uniref:uncharacterized protein LOC124683119 n=1 Tax=Lolium rigidum TaxID=89674 RepID=UPI001F5E0778|nr:uncharacterized protein LOC124683119 [Lolium rigidum]
MSCFAMRSSSSSRVRGGRQQPWRWLRRCAGLAAAAHARLRRTVVRVRWSGPGRLGGHRHHRSPAPPLPSVQRGHHRSFAPVYVDELYSQPKGLSVVREEVPQVSTSKLARDTDRTAGVVSKAPVHGAGAAAATTTGGGSKARAGGRSAGVRGLLLSPGRGGCGMGEVDVRAEMFIRKFREEMRLQSQRSAEEFQAMLARGL